MEKGIKHTLYVRCNKCKGEGIVKGEECKKCKGTGHVLKLDIGDRKFKKTLL